jgi:hypothetical protein
MRQAFIEVLMLGEDAVFDAADKVFDFAGAGSGTGIAKGSFAAESFFGGGKPLDGGWDFTVEEIDRFFEDGADAEETFGLIGGKATSRSTASEGPLGDAEDGGEFYGIEAGVGFKLAESVEGEAGFDLADELEGALVGDAEG